MRKLCFAYLKCEEQAVHEDTPDNQGFSSLTRITISVRIENPREKRVIGPATVIPMKKTMRTSR